MGKKDLKSSFHRQKTMLAENFELFVAQKKLAPIAVKNKFLDIK